MGGEEKSPDRERVTASDHDLNAIGPAALIGITEQPHVPRVIGLGQFLVH
jgi:hypothetical protein